MVSAIDVNDAASLTKAFAIQSRPTLADLPRWRGVVHQVRRGDGFTWAVFDTRGAGTVSARWPPSVDEELRAAGISPVDVEGRTLIVQGKLVADAPEPGAIAIEAPSRARLLIE